MAADQPRNVVVSWIIGLGCVAGLVAAWRAESWALTALILFFGIMGLFVAIVIRRGPPWGRIAYAIWAVPLVAFLLARDLQVEPELTKVLLGFCLYAGALALVGLSIRSDVSEAGR